MRKLIFVLVLSFASTLAQAASTTMTRLNFRSTSELALWTVTAQQTNLTATVSDVGNYSFAPGSTATVDSPRVIASVGVAGRWILNQATDVELISSGGAPMALVTVPSITSLASHKPKPGQTNVYIMGYSSVGDGGQGRFSYSSSFPSWTTVTNEVCIAATGGGYWFREEVATGTLNAKWFGMSGTVTNDVNSGGALARMQVLANNNKWRIYFPKGDYYVETWVTYTNHANVHWQGDGMELSRILTTVGHDGSGGQIIYWKGVTNAVFEDLAFNGATNMIVATRARSAGIATIHMHRPMNMWPGTRVNITGMGDSTYNASQAVVLTMPNSSTFTYASAGANETEASDYSGQVMVTFAIWAGGGDWKDDTTAPATCTTDSRSSGVVTMNFSGAHGFTNGCSVTITGSSRGLNVTNAIMTVVDADTITYPLAGGDLGSAADASASADQEWSYGVYQGGINLGYRGMQIDEGYYVTVRRCDFSGHFNAGLRFDNGTWANYSVESLLVDGCKFSHCGRDFYNATSGSDPVRLDTSGGGLSWSGSPLGSRNSEVRNCLFTDLGVGDGHFHATYLAGESGFSFNNNRVIGTTNSSTAFTTDIDNSQTSYGFKCYDNIFALTALKIRAQTGLEIVGNTFTNSKVQFSGRGSLFANNHAWVDPAGSMYSEPYYFIQGFNNSPKDSYVITGNSLYNLVPSTTDKIHFYYDALAMNNANIQNNTIYEARLATITTVGGTNLIIANNAIYAPTYTTAEGLIADKKGGSRIYGNSIVCGATARAFEGENTMATELEFARNTHIGGVIANMKPSVQTHTIRGTAQTFNGDVVTDPSTPLTISQKWNDGADTFRLLSLIVTNTASAAASRPFEIKGGAGGATDLVYVDGSGNLYANGVYTLGTGENGLDSLIVTNYIKPLNATASRIAVIGADGTITNATVAVADLQKHTGYIVLAMPFTCDGTGAIIYTNAYNVSYYGQAKFSNSAATNANYIEYRITVPEDIDTSVDLKVARWKFMLTGADTGKHAYRIGMVSVADSAGIDSPTISNYVKLDFAGDASGAQNDVETVSNITLTNWKSNVTAGQQWIIRVQRAGDDGTDDTSTVDSYSGTLVISYGTNQ